METAQGTVTAAAQSRVLVDFGLTRKTRPRPNCPKCGRFCRADGDVYLTIDGDHAVETDCARCGRGVAQ